MLLVGTAALDRQRGVAGVNNGPGRETVGGPGERSYLEVAAYTPRGEDFSVGDWLVVGRALVACCANAQTISRTARVPRLMAATRRTVRIDWATRP